jgi:sulfite exporter TauE/SafE
VSILAGVMILLFVFSSLSLTSGIRGVSKWNARVQHKLGTLLQSPKSSSAFFSIGLLNGLLPCGLVYVALAAALATTHALYGGLLMMAFGLGTFPVMAGLMVFGHLISVRFRQKLNRAVPYFISVLAVILILRGMNLGIPFISPKMDPKSASIENCHIPS